ncbi:DNA cytosine methyltransferase [Arthrobacter sp.]|uniref:DNA cytosine methyltransferase n=1 Tax=Arthrobacter sp. TaxID=1667 RepID=UPI003A8EF8EC
MNSPKVVSLFSGCGGLDLGFERAGFEIVFAADHDPAAVKAYKRNIGSEAHVLDVRSNDFEASLRRVPSCDVLLGGFPCQGFSKAGPKQHTDERNQLYRAMIKALEILRPATFVAENVDGLAQNFSGRFLKEIINDCAAVGYSVEWKLVDAAWFGIPQHRRRILIVGRRADLSGELNFDWPIADHEPITRNGERALHHEYKFWAGSLQAPRTLADAIADIPANAADHETRTAAKTSKTLAIMRSIKTGQKLCNARHDVTSVKTWDIPEAYGETTPDEREILNLIVRNRRHKKYGSIPNGNPLSLVTISALCGREVSLAELASLVSRGFLKQVGEKWDVAGAMFASGLYKRPQWQVPSPTVLTNFDNPRFFLHPTANRPFTVREVARMQTFPDNFVFQDAGVSPREAYRLVGNAVPPLLGMKVALAIMDMLAKRVARAAA